MFRVFFSWVSEASFLYKHLQAFSIYKTSIYKHLQAFKSFQKHVQAFTSIHKHSQVFTSIHKHLQAFTSIYKHLQGFTSIYKTSIYKHLHLQGINKHLQEGRQATYTHHCAFDPKMRSKMYLRQHDHPKRFRSPPFLS